jgi:hypothetical protein
MCDCENDPIQTEPVVPNLNIAVMSNVRSTHNAYNTVMVDSNEIDADLFLNLFYGNSAGSFSPIASSEQTFMNTFRVQNSPLLLHNWMVEAYTNKTSYIPSEIQEIKLYQELDSLTHFNKLNGRIVSMNKKNIATYLEQFSSIEKLSVTISVIIYSTVLDISVQFNFRFILVPPTLTLRQNLYVLKERLNIAYKQIPSTLSAVEQQKQRWILVIVGELEKYTTDINSSSLSPEIKAKLLSIHNTQIYHIFDHQGLPNHIIRKDETYEIVDKINALIAEQVHMTGLNGLPLGTHTLGLVTFQTASDLQLSGYGDYIWTPGDLLIFGGKDKRKKHKNHIKSSATDEIGKEITDHSYSIACEGILTSVGVATDTEGEEIPASIPLCDVPGAVGSGPAYDAVSSNGKKTGFKVAHSGKQFGKNLAYQAPGIAASYVGVPTGTSVINSGVAAGIHELSSLF